MVFKFHIFSYVSHQQPKLINHFSWTHSKMYDLVLNFSSFITVVLKEKKSLKKHQVKGALSYTLTPSTICNTLWVNIDPVTVALKILRKIHTSKRNQQLCGKIVSNTNNFSRKTELSAVHFWSHNWRTTWATRRDLAASPSSQLILPAALVACLRSAMSWKAQGASEEGLVTYSIQF